MTPQTSEGFVTDMLMFEGLMLQNSVYAAEQEDTGQHIRQ